jgi:hypothetical protein
MKRPNPVQAPPATIVAAAGTSWLGFIIHNVGELPAGALLGPDTIAPTAVYLLLLGSWWWPGPRTASWLLLGWGWLQAVGGGLLSVLPLPLWPFQPEQTPKHYALHAIYAALQAPLLITLTRHVRRDDQRVRKPGSR